MSLDQVVDADTQEQIQSDDEDECFFQDIDMLQNHGIVCAPTVLLNIYINTVGRYRR